MTPSEKLRALADWFDLYDIKNPSHQINGKEVQNDLRSIADNLLSVSDFKENLKKEIEKKMRYYSQCSTAIPTEDLFKLIDSL